MSWKKSTFKKEIEGVINDRMVDNHFVYDKVRKIYVKKGAGSFSSIHYQTTVSDCPMTCVGFHFRCAIYLNEVTQLLDQLSNGYNHSATLFGYMKIFTKRTSNNGIYYFDWAKDYSKKLEELFEDIQDFDSFSGRINSAFDLAPENIGRIPFVRKLFPLGLEDDYNYCTPAVAALVWALNGKIKHALTIAEKDLQRALRISLRPKSNISEENFRVEQDLRFSQNLVEYINGLEKADL